MAQRLTFALLTATLVFTVVAAAAQTDAKRETAALIQRAIKLLEAKNYAEFFRTCVRPSEVAELVDDFGSFDKLAAAYADTDRPRQMLAVLKAAVSIEPSLSEDGARATYTFAKPVEGESSLRLRRIEGRWFLYD
jgi:hypothetical protein